MCLLRLIATLLDLVEDDERQSKNLSADYWSFDNMGNIKLIYFIESYDELTILFVAPFISAAVGDIDAFVLRHIVTFFIR